MQSTMSAADVAAHLAASHVRQSPNPTDCRARTATSEPARRTTPAPVDQEDRPMTRTPPPYLTAAADDDIIWRP